jgi:nucleoid DNA-binding protein
MKREELARRFASENRVSRAQARDQVDALVHKILKSVRQGRAVDLPGLGRLVGKPRPAQAGLIPDAARNDPRAGGRQRPVDGRAAIGQGGASGRMIDGRGSGNQRGARQ